ncbi:unnamed protein product [Musa acuminata subsp. malaccensis]|uniref:(wild Malaysian banana) hypothetical protein n=1 Tax=Musa acuminata subsp. malaccensis TaxID=214687 RepID=A0A804HWP3_MUSAM|nr:unnamed protein product [Musa acuminata subsp. malaccensis]
MHKFNKLKKLLNFLLLILYEDIGIRLPKGVIPYGEPRIGIIFLLWAVANSTSATFLHVFGSELIHKYLGDGPKLLYRHPQQSPVASSFTTTDVVCYHQLKY